VQTGRWNYSFLETKMASLVSLTYPCAIIIVSLVALPASSAAQALPASPSCNEAETACLRPAPFSLHSASPVSPSPDSTFEVSTLPDPIPAGSSEVQQPGNKPPTQPRAKRSPERELLKNILRDQKAIWTWPLQIRGDQARWLLPLAGGTAALIATDRYTAEDAGEFNNNSTHRTISTDVSYAGFVYGVAGVAGSFYLVGRVTDNPKARETGLLVAEAAADGTIVSQVLKYIAQRPRPGSDSGHGGFFDGGSSFPSAHSTVAWAMAAVVAHEYRGHKWVAISAYGIAALVGAARFAGHEHFISDVLAGSVIGYGIGRHVYTAHHDPEVDSQAAESQNGHRIISLSRVELTPRYNPARREYGLSASVKF
jgi:membrane-associated phospholipid phosphatase